jgi:putative oxidoreductase
MWKNLSNYNALALLFFRVTFGTFFIWVHGWPKLAGGLDTWKKVGGAMQHVGLDFWPGFWGFLAAFSESIGCGLFIIGFCFRPASALLFITLSVAAIMKINTARGNALFEAAHPLELALVFLTLIFIGPGKYSVDRG